LTAGIDRDQLLGNLMKKRKRSRTKSVNRLLTGLIITWSEPAESAFQLGGEGMLDAKISHSNPVHRLICNEIWRRFGYQIYRQLKLLWRVKIYANFSSENTGSIVEAVEVVEFMCLESIADSCQPAIDELSKMSGLLSSELDETVSLDSVNYSIECIGSRDKKELDFSIS